MGLTAAADWVGREYHPRWSFVDALERGISIHHGGIPRALSQLNIALFNEGILPFLICTSTLIEGVNTAAKNVVVYENKIATAKLDFFTFNNIKDRSGRMFHHFLGNVFY
jgi:replicative superfamily II helicase